MVKPPVICKLEEGKLIDTFDGFVTSWNWLAESLHNLKGGDNIDIDWQDGSHPVINSKGGGGGQFEGTDGSQTDGTSSPVKFASAADSNVVVTCADDTITIGVYYV